VLHGADYDVTTLKRDFGYSFASLFDTMIAARLLGRSEIGLAAVARDELGVALSKDSQKDDWSRRPLTPRQEAYALADVVHLVELRDPELVARHRGEADLALPEEARRDHGIEEGGEGEGEVPLERRHVVVGPVEHLDERGIGQGRREGREVAYGERVHEKGLAPVGSELDQADLVEVVVQAVRLGVEADRAAALEGANERGQRLRRADPGRRHGPEYTLDLERERKCMQESDLRPPSRTASLVLGGRP
jgi:hypothetical protein